MCFHCVSTSQRVHIIPDILKSQWSTDSVLRITAPQIWILAACTCSVPSIMRRVSCLSRPTDWSDKDHWRSGSNGVFFCHLFAAGQKLTWRQCHFDYSHIVIDLPARGEPQPYLHGIFSCAAYGTQNVLYYKWYLYLAWFCFWWWFGFGAW